MPYQADVIMQALAPGIALTSMIFYYGNLQQRLIFTVETIRKLNAEARQLREGADPPMNRLESLRWQVGFLSQRFTSIRQAILFVYAGFFSSILTILSLLVLGFLDRGSLAFVPYATFAVGLVSLGCATVISSGEITLAQKTIMEDIANTYASP